MRTQPFVPPPAPKVAQKRPNAQAAAQPQSQAPSQAPSGGAQVEDELMAAVVQEAQAILRNEPPLPFSGDIGTGQVLLADSAGQVSPQTLITGLYTAVMWTRQARPWHLYDVQGILRVAADAKRELSGDIEWISAYQQMEHNVLLEHLLSARSSLTAFRSKVPENARKADVMLQLERNVAEISAILEERFPVSQG